MGLAACPPPLAGWPFSSKAGARLPSRLHGFPKPRWSVAALARDFLAWPWRASRNAPKAAPSGSSQLGCLCPQPLTGGRHSGSEHRFISALGAFKSFHLTAACQKGRSFKDRNCCKVHAEGQVGGGRRASSLLLSGEETAVSSPSIKRSWRSLAGLQGKVTRLSKFLCFWRH